MNNNKDIETLINIIAKSVSNGQNTNETLSQLKDLLSKGAEAEKKAVAEKTEPEAANSPDDGKNADVTVSFLSVGNPAEAEAFCKKLKAPLPWEEDAEADNEDDTSEAPEQDYSDELISEIERRLDNVIGLCKLTMDKFYKFVKTREYKNATLNYPRTAEHLLSIADTTCDMETLMNNVVRANNMMSTIDSIFPDYFPDVLADSFIDAHERVDNMTAVILPQYEMMEKKFGYVIGG